jgi:hypothetical protein
MPDKLAELQQRWLDEARRYNVLPLDDRRVERFNADLAGRPVLIHGNSQLLFAGMGRLTENVMINIKNKSHAVTAQVEVPEGGATGRRVPRAARSAAGRSTCTRAAGVLLQPVRPAPVQVYARTRCAGATSCAEVRTTAVGGRHRRPVRSTGPKSARAGSTSPQPMCSPATRPRT